MRAVIDTSYLVEFLRNPFGDDFKWVFDCDLMAPDLLVYELHNVFLKALRIEKDHIDKFHETLANLKFEYVNIYGNEKEIYRLAVEHGLSFYDASYLWLAIKGDIPLATFDKQMLKITECRFIKNCEAA
jgi:predicted nucleic acid-binding protein